MNVKLDARQVVESYSAMLRRLASLTGFSSPAIVRAEVGVVLKTCAGKTKVSSLEQIDRGTRLHVARALGYTGGGERTSDASINVGIRGEEGRVWFHTRNDKFQLAGQLSHNGGSMEWANLHFRRGDFQQIQATVRSYQQSVRGQLPVARKALGLARQSWVQIADDLGIRLESVQGGGTLSAGGIAKARAAIATTGLAYRNGQGAQFQEATRFFVRLTNSLPFGDRLGFDGMILIVLNGRIKLFERSYAKGAFESLEKAAHNFPYLRVAAPAGLAA